MWCILVNRKLAKPQVYGPISDYAEAMKIEEALAREPGNRSTRLTRMSGIRIEDGQLIHEAFI